MAPQSYLVFNTHYNNTHGRERQKYAQFETNFSSCTRRSEFEIRQQAKFLPTTPVQKTSVYLRRAHAFPYLIRFIGRSYSIPVINNLLPYFHLPNLQRTSASRKSLIKIILNLFFNMDTFK